jgi:hypothetical protein
MNHGTNNSILDGKAHNGPGCGAAGAFLKSGLDKGRCQSRPGKCIRHFIFFGLHRIGFDHRSAILFNVINRSFDHLNAQALMPVLLVHKKAGDRPHRQGVGWLENPFKQLLRFLKFHFLELSSEHLPDCTFGELIDKFKNFGDLIGRQFFFAVAGDFFFR